MKKIVVPVIVVSIAVAAFMVGSASSNTNTSIAAPAAAAAPTALVTTTTSAVPTSTTTTSPTVAPTSKPVVSTPNPVPVAKPVPTPSPVAVAVVVPTQPAPVVTTTTTTQKPVPVPAPVVPACLVLPNTGNAFNLAGMTIDEARAAISYRTQVSQNQHPGANPFVQRSPCVPVLPEECPEVLTWNAPNSGSGQYVNDVMFKIIPNFGGHAYLLQGVQTIDDVATRVQEYMNYLKTVQQNIVDTTCRNRIG